MKRLSRSIFAELKAAPTEKVVATAELLPRESSIRFPTCSTISLEGDDDASVIALPEALNARATLVTLSFQALGQAQLKAWKPFFEAFAVVPVHASPATLRELESPAAIDLLYLDGIFFNIMRRFFVNSSRRSLETAQRPYNGIIFQPSDKATDVRWSLGTVTIT